jgi:hypothetical protein
MILSVDGTAVNDPGDLSSEIEDREGKTVDLEVVRDKRPMHIKVTLPAAEDEDAPKGPRAQLYRIPAMAPRAPMAVPPVPALAPPVPPAPPAPPLPRTLASVFV